MLLFHSPTDRLFSIVLLARNTIRSSQISRKSARLNCNVVWDTRTEYGTVVERRESYRTILEGIEVIHYTMNYCPYCLFKLLNSQPMFFCRFIYCEQSFLKFVHFTPYITFHYRFLINCLYYYKFNMSRFICINLLFVL